MPLEDIPKFLQIPQDQRKKAWDDRRIAAKPMPPEAPPALRRIPSLPGAKDDGDS
jgi:hypothetical protein